VLKTEVKIAVSLKYISRMPHTCSICKQEGHNKRGCKQNATPTPSKPHNPISPTVEEQRIQQARDEAERKVREQIAHERAVILKAKEEQKAKAEAEKVAREKAEAEKIAREKAEAEKKTWAEKVASQPVVSQPVVSQPVVSQPKPFINHKKDPTLAFIFENIFDARASMEFLLLREQFSSNPNQFRILGTTHFSNDEDEPHISFEFKRTFTLVCHDGKSIERTWVRIYHLYFITLPSGKQKYTHVTQRDRENKSYTLANFTAY
jgi:hypothetical protein